MRTKDVLAMVFALLVLVVPSLFLGRMTWTGWDALVWFASVILTGVVLRFWVPRSAHAFLLLSVLGHLAWGGGWAEILTLVFWLFSAWSLGAWVLRWAGRDAPLSEIGTTEALVTGVAIWLAVWGCMLHFPVNYRWVYLVLGLLPCLALARQALELGSIWRSRWMVAHDGIRSIPMWAWILGLGVITWVLRWAFFPTVGYDDHAQHRHQQQCSHGWATARPLDRTLEPAGRPCLNRLALPVTPQVVRKSLGAGVTLSRLFA